VGCVLDEAINRGMTRLQDEADEWEGWHALAAQRRGHG
jgi:hypothetical protein